MDIEMGAKSWETAEVKFWSGSGIYYYRNPVAVARYLIRQRTFIQELVYTPIREYDSAGQQVYSEIHLVHWWWETQVGLLDTDTNLELPVLTLI